MAALLTNMRYALIAGFVLALITLFIFVLVGGSSDVSATLTGAVFWQFIFRWLRSITSTSCKYR
jgi:hypothetical protein